MFFTASYGSERRLSTNMHSSHSRALTLSPYRPTGYLSQLTVAPHVGGWRPSSAVCYAPYSTIGRVVRVLYNYYIGSLITRTETGYACVRSADPFPMLRDHSLRRSLPTQQTLVACASSCAGRPQAGWGREASTVLIFVTHLRTRRNPLEILRMIWLVKKTFDVPHNF
jgi:hypothetical protein